MATVPKRPGGRLTLSAATKRAAREDPRQRKFDFGLRLAPKPSPVPSSASNTPGQSISSGVCADVAQSLSSSRRISNVIDVDETTHVRARMSAHASRQIYIHTCAGARTRTHGRVHTRA